VAAATVNAGMRVLFENSQPVVKNITLCFGGMAPNTVIATKTAKQLIGRFACSLLSIK